MSLETELAFFEAHRVEWIEHHEGKFALIRHEVLHGVCDTYEAAYAAGVQEWGNVPFLVKQILREDLVEESPALVYGLLNAHP
jgi:hypothetical protein